jgi:OmpA-OmpF porin, OOP family
MKKFLPVVFASCLISSTAFAGSGPGFPGFYVGANIGTAFTKNVPLSGSVPSGTYAANLTTKTGVTVNGTVGYDFGLVRVEEEVGYQQNSVGGTATTTTGTYQATSTTQPLTGNISVVSFMTNVRKDFEVGGVSPYVTAGIGAANVSFNDVSDGTTNIKYHKTKFASKLGVGVSYSITPNIFADLCYTYSPTARFESPVNSAEKIRFTTHTIKAGVGYRF